MTYRGGIALTGDLALTSPEGLAVWQQILRARFPLPPRAARWRVMETAFADNTFRITARRGLFRGAELTLRVSEGGDEIAIHTEPFSPFRRYAAGVIGGLAAAVVAGAVILDGGGSLLGLLVAIPVAIVATGVAWPFTAVLARLATTTSRDLGPFVGVLKHAMGDADAIAAFVEATHEARREHAASLPKVTEADIEEEDRHLSLDALERKYGLRRGGAIHAMLHARPDEADASV